MQRVDPNGLRAWKQKADEKQSRVLSPGFEGTVTNVRGSAGNYQVQMILTGEARSSGQWHQVEANGTVPVRGARAQGQWINQGKAVVTSMLSQPSVAPAHSYLCRAFWTGSVALSVGWSVIPYNNVSANGDPSGMMSGVTSPVIQLDGDYDVTVRVGAASATPSLEITAGIWLNGSQVSQGTDAAQYSGGYGIDQIDQDLLIGLKKGDVISGYVYTNTAATPLSPGSLFSYIIVALRSQ